MKNLVIIGSGSYGREIYHLAQGCNGYDTEFIIKGYIDNLYIEVGFDGYPPIIGRVDDYIPQEDDVFVCAIMDVDVKKKYVESILNRGGKFINLIHHTVSIWGTPQIGVGCIICNNVQISCEVVLGDFVTIQSLSLLGHDVVIGDYCHLNAQTFYGGKVIVGEQATVNTGAIIHPGVKIGAHSVIGAGSVVLRNVKENVTMFGNPAKVLNI